MCGIAAIFNYKNQRMEVAREELRRTRDAMAFRGPDGCGEWFSSDGRVGLGHRRLSIIDLSENGAQPMVDENNRLAVSFNGEIYNYRELKAQLLAKGYKFRSQSDTEVLLHLYADKGEAMVHDLRGMFAFALWDNKKKGLFLARDPYGIKPLYYSDDGNTLRVASQVKALLAGGKVSRTLDPAGAVGFFLLGSVPEPYTLYQNIRELPAGSTLWIDSSMVSGAQPKKYLSISKIIEDAKPASRADAFEIVRKALLDSVKHHFIADVPVGIFLSSGIDSSTLVALAKEIDIHDLHTATLGFDEFLMGKEDEAPLAKIVAQYYGTHHSLCRLTQKEFLDDLPQFWKAMDQPTLDGVNTYFVSKAVARTGLKVVLSGLGGDELFGGYPSFWSIPAMVRLVRAPSQLSLLNKPFRYLVERMKFLPPVLRAKISGLIHFGGSYSGAYFLRRGLFMPWELNTVLPGDMVEEGLKRLCVVDHIRREGDFDSPGAYGRVAAMEASLYMRNQLLRDADWAGMAHSIEIRTPFVDVELLRSLAPIFQFIKNSKKQFLANSPQKPLPNEIKTRAKTGFRIPIEKWLDSDPELHSWKKIPSLAEPRCHWSRRWAYAVFQQYNH